MSSTIKVNNIQNLAGDDSGIDLSTNDQIILKTANTTAITVDSSQGVTVAGAFTSRGIDDNADATAITIDSSENVGIGTSSPSETLTVAQGTVERAIAVCSSDANVGGFIGASGDSGSANKLIINASRGSGAIIFQTVSDEKIRIDGSNLLVGTTSATGSIAKGVAIHFTASVGAGLELKGSNTSGTFSSAIFRDGNGTDCGSIDVNATANTTSYTTSSDHRLKENVTADWNATTRLKQLNPVRFNFISDADTTVDGFLAHEVQSVVPEAITGTHNEVEVWKDGEELPDGVSVGDNKLDEDGNTIPVYQGIDQSKLVPLLVKTIQELEARITALENQ